MTFENRNYFEKSCAFHLLTAKSKCLHQIYVFSKVVLEIFVAEKFLGDGLINIVLKNLKVLGRAISNMLNKLTELLEIKSSDIILVFSHRIQDGFYHEFLLLVVEILENCQ